MKVRIDDAKKIELADDKKRKEIKEKPYCGHPDAAVIYKDKDSGEWVITKNEEIMMFEREKDEKKHNNNETVYKPDSDKNGLGSNNDHGIDSHRARLNVTQPGTVPTSQTITSTARTLPPAPTSAAPIGGMELANKLVPNYPPPNINMSGQRAEQYASQQDGGSNGSGYNGKDDLPHSRVTAELHNAADLLHGRQRQHMPQHGEACNGYGQKAEALPCHWRIQDAQHSGSVWSPGEHPRYSRQELPRGDGRFEHHWIERTATA